MTRQAITELDPDQVRIEVRALLAPLGRRLWQREAQALPMPRASAVCRHRIEARPRWLLRRQVLLNDERPINLVMKGSRCPPVGSADRSQASGSGLYPDRPPRGRARARAGRGLVSDNPVDHPRHYTTHPAGIECIDVVETMGFNLGNTVKYIWRAGLKSDDALTDLKKAAWYLDREIARLEGSRPEAGGTNSAPVWMKAKPS